MTIELRPGVSEQDELDYFDRAQQMFNSYYSRPAFRGKEIDFLEADHPRTMSKFIECIIWGVANKM